MHIPRGTAYTYAYATRTARRRMGLVQRQASLLVMLQQLLLPPTGCARVIVGIEPSTRKVQVQQTPSSTSAIDLAAQRGECESAQILVRTDDLAGIRNISVQFFPLFQDEVAEGLAGSFSPAHWSARQLGYVSCHQNPNSIPSVEQSPGWQPDPLLRLDWPDSGADRPNPQLYPRWSRNPVGTIPYVPQNHTQSIWVTVCVPRNATPGVFTGNLSVYGVVHETHQWHHIIPVTLEIWSLTVTEVGDSNALGTAFIWLEPTNAANWTHDCFLNGNDSLYKHCEQRDEWLRFLRRNRVPPSFGGTLGGPGHTLEGTRAGRDLGGARWMQLLDVTTLGALRILNRFHLNIW